MKKNNIWGKWIYWFTFALATILIYKTLDSFNDVTSWLKELIGILMPFMLAILIAYLFYMPARKLESLYKKIKFKFIVKRARPLSVATVYVLAIFVIVLVINFVFPAISESVVDLANNLPNYYNNALEWFNNLPEESILKQEEVKDAIKKLQQIDIASFISIERIGEYIKGVIGIAGTVFTVFVTIIVSIYILLERGEILNFIRKSCRAMFKKDTCIKLDEYFEKTNEIFFKFISSQILDGIVVGVIVSIAMSLMNIKYAVLLGFMIGLFNIIPYFGAIIAVIIAVIITIFTGGFSEAILLAIVVIILQQIDANIINPKIVGSSLKLSPILVIFSVTVGGAYFGVLGMFLAVPVVAILKIIVLDYIEYKTKSKS